MQDWLEESESVGRRIVESDDHVASTERITKAASPDWAVTLHDGRQVTAERITKVASPDWAVTHVSANWNERSSLTEVRVGAGGLLARHQLSKSEWGDSSKVSSASRRRGVLVFERDGDGVGGVADVDLWTWAPAGTTHWQRDGDH